MLTQEQKLDGLKENPALLIKLTVSTIRVFYLSYDDLEFRVRGGGAISCARFTYLRYILRGTSGYLLGSRRAYYYTIFRCRYTEYFICFGRYFYLVLVDLKIPINTILLIPSFVLIATTHLMPCKRGRLPRPYHAY